MAHQKNFYLNGGSVFSTLEKLSKELQTMSDEVFMHHVNKDKHDFKEWIKYSLKKEDLAGSVEDKIDKLELELEILRYLVHEEPKRKSKKFVSTKISPKKELKPKALEKKSSVKKSSSKKTPVKSKTSSKK